MRERIVRAVAGLMVSLSLLLAVTVDVNWLLLAAFVAVNLFQSSLTKFCPLEVILKKVGVEE